MMPSFLFERVFTILVGFYLVADEIFIVYWLALKSVLKLDAWLLEDYFMGVPLCILESTGENRLLAKPPDF